MTQVHFGEHIQPRCISAGLYCKMWISCVEQAQLGSLVQEKSDSMGGSQIIPGLCGYTHSYYTRIVWERQISPGQSGDKDDFTRPVCKYHTYFLSRNGF